MALTRRFFGIAAGASLSGCALLTGKSPIPLDQFHDDGGCPDTLAPGLLVLLPGAHMTIGELQREGFVAAVRQRQLAVDVLIAGTEIGHAQDGSAIHRLHDEVMLPARARGHRRIWLAGISLGAYLALQYERTHPGGLQGLLLIAPYLGRRTLLNDIAANGPAAWRRARPAAMPPDDVDVALWAWLAAPPATLPPLWLAAGSEDRFADAHRLLAGLLPPANTSFAPGGHTWAPWRALWARWLDAGVLPASCTGTAGVLPTSCVGPAGVLPASRVEASVPPPSA